MPRKMLHAFYWVLILFLFSGCAVLKETTRGFLGVSTKQIEDARSRSLSKSFNCDYQTCDNKVREALKDIKAYIYREDLSQRLIAFYVSESDTTPVGVFLTEIDANNTKVELASPSTYAVEEMSKEIFPFIENALTKKERTP
jgi:hypothetical protein